MKRNLVLRAVRAACVAMLLSASSGVVSAQSVVEQAGPFAIPVSSKSVERMSVALKLDGDQKVLARSLYSGYRAQFRQAAEAGDAQIRVLNEKAQEDGMAGFAAQAKERVRVTREFVEKADRLEKDLLSDLRAILTPEQAVNFERAERARRREIGLKFAFIAGEGVDVFQILQDLKIDRDSNAALKEELDAYEEEVDRAMIAKDKMLRGVFDQMEKFEGPEPDFELIKKTLQGFFDSGARVRDVHRQLVRKAMPLLPQDQQEPFDRAVKRASFPVVYRESAADKTIKAAQGLADLSADQKAELVSISENYRREGEAANARWAAAIEEKQSKMSGEFAEMMGGMQEDKPDDPLKQAREARKALDERIIARVTQVLKAEQRVRMPEIERDEDTHGREYMPDFDGEDVWEEWKKEDDK